MKNLFESLFDKNLVNKDIPPFEIAKIYKDYQYNESDGGKDCLGQPLKEGDLILVCEDPYGHTRMNLAVYIKQKGRFCQFWCVNPELNDREDLAPEFLQLAYCSKVVKINKDSVKL